MKDFEELTEDKQNEVIMNIGTKLTGQEIWYWEGLVHKLREYEKFIDDDFEIRKGLVDRINRQEKEIERLHSIIKEAREYIQDRYDGEVLTHTFDKCNVKELLKILQGSDKE